MDAAALGTSWLGAWRSQKNASISTKSTITPFITAQQDFLPANPPILNRRLILLRHAKSSWADSRIRDHDRPLTRRGRRAAASIAGKLKERNWVPELILCSDAIRTRQTLDVMQRQFLDFLKAKVHFIGSYYSVAAMDGHTAAHLQETICKHCNDQMKTIMCMGHNRGWEEAATSLCGINVELKTANAALLEASGSSWKEAFTCAGIGGWKLIEILRPDFDKDIGPFDDIV